MDGNGNDGFGCAAYGHLASPFVDDELSAEERERFATHLDACAPCHARRSLVLPKMARGKGNDR